MCIYRGVYCFADNAPRRIHHAIQTSLPFMSPRAPIFVPNRPRGGAQQRPPGGPQPGPAATPIFRQRVVSDFQAQTPINVIVFTIHMIIAAFTFCSCCV